MRTTKRRVLLATGTLAAGGIALTQTTQNAQASVDVTSLDVPDQETVTTDPIQDVLLEVSGEWSYSGNVTPDEWELTLEAGNSADMTHPLATVSGASDLSSEGSGEFTLTGSLLDSPHFDMSNFKLSNTGDEKSTPFTCALDFVVRRDGDVVAEARAVDSATITVTKEAVEVSASVEGSGGITVETE